MRDKLDLRKDFLIKSIKDVFNKTLITKNLIAFLFAKNINIGKINQQYHKNKHIYW